MNYTQWRLDQLTPIKQKDENDYEIDEQELLGYAEHIGIKLPEQTYLLDIAQEGLRAKIPPEWRIFQCPDQSYVYQNTETGEIIQEHPLDQIYRQVIIQARNNQSKEYGSQSPQLSELSEIVEEENQFGNQSDVYERKRATSPYNHRDNLRVPITEEGIRQLNEAHHQRQLSKLTQNSALEKNISMDQSSSISKKGLNSNRILPSSVLQNYKSLQNPSLEQYQTELTQRDDKNSKEQSEYSSNSLANELRIDEAKLKKQLERQIQQLKKQQKLKLDLLNNLQKRNSKIFERLKRKINSKRTKQSSHPTSKI